MSDEMLTDIRMYSCILFYLYSYTVRILQDDMVNKDTVTKQEEKLQSMTEEIKSTDADYQDEQLLNLQLSCEHNTLMTNLSHVLNQRNSLLLECEGLKDTITILTTQMEEISHQVELEQHQRDTIAECVAQCGAQWGSWYESLQDLEEDITHRTYRIFNED